ncbi:O-antigen ligase family protein [Magnetovibrio sp. PR-2]|uniref:O-antigen ligase family protein n=1 Tax=Magnetovibrio sp. PR-2 TaxID=3120356 RepID=UPI002FCE1747
MIGAGVPLMMFGRSVMQADLALALLCTLVFAWRTPGVFSRVAQAGTPLIKGLMVLTALLWLPGFFESLDITKSFKTWSRTFVFIALCALIWAFLRHDKSYRELALKTLVVVTNTLTAISCISFWFWPELMEFLRNEHDLVLRPDLWLKSYGASTLCLAPVMVWAAYKLPKNWTASCLAAMVMCCIVIFETSNRASIAGLIGIVLTLAAVFSLRNQRARMPILAAAVLLVCVMFVWLLNFGPTFLSPPNAYLPTWLIDPHRQIIWKFTFEHTQEVMWFGRGIDTINLTPGTDGDASPGNLPLIPSHPHNWLLEIYSETGLAGLMSLLSLLAMVLWAHVKSALKNHDGNMHESLTILALSAGFWVSASFNFSIWSTWWLLTYFMLFALVTSFRNPETIPNEVAS